MACKSMALLPLGLQNHHLIIKQSAAFLPRHSLLFSFQSLAFQNPNKISKSPTPPLYLFPSIPHKRALICNAAEYVFPDPIPEFADTETEKFRANLLKKLSKKDIFGESINEVVTICTEIFNNFLHTEYGGPGTLLVIPFIDMADTLNERGLPGGPQAARAAVVWAQKHVDKDWNAWVGGYSDSSNNS